MSTQTLGAPHKGFMWILSFHWIAWHQISCQTQLNMTSHKLYTFLMSSFCITWKSGVYFEFIQSFRYFWDYEILKYDPEFNQIFLLNESSKLSLSRVSIFLRVETDSKNVWKGFHLNIPSLRTVIVKSFSRTQQNNFLV